MIINGDYKVGEYMTTDHRIPLVSATGSTRMGRIVGATVAERFGKSLLELGGNNAIIITPTADLKVVVPGAYLVLLVLVVKDVLLQED